MTLALACLTHQYTMVVADQRLWEFSRAHPNGIKNDGANKVVNMGMVATFTFSGVGMFDHCFTDRWLAKQLASRATGASPISFGVAIQAIRDEATDWFRQQVPRTGRRTDDPIFRHTFVGVGALRPNVNGLVVITNASRSTQLKTRHPRGADYRFQWAESPVRLFSSAVIECKARMEPIVLPIGVDAGRADCLIEVALKRARESGTKEEVQAALQEVIREIAKTDEGVSPESTVVVNQTYLSPDGSAFVSAGSMTGAGLFVAGSMVLGLGMEQLDLSEC